MAKTTRSFELVLPLRTKLRRVRERQLPKMKKVDASSELGVTPLTYHRMELGADLKLSHALRLARLFKQPVEALWELREPAVLAGSREEAA